MLTYRSKYYDFYEEAQVFQSKVQERIDANTSEELDVTLQDSFPQQAVRRKRKHFFDEAADERVTNDPKEQCRLDVFLPIIDRLADEITTRFKKRTQLRTLCRNIIS